MRTGFNPSKYGGDFDWKDIYSESQRTYHFPDGSTFTIEEPEAIAYKPPFKNWAGGSHRVVDKKGTAFFIPQGWIAISWTKEDPNDTPYNW